MENLKDMKIKKIIKYYILGESVKEIELNRILDKISNGKKLSKKEISFLNLYQITRSEDIKDFMYLSKNDTHFKIKDLLNREIKVICDLCDQDGKIGLPIIETDNFFEDEKSTLHLKDGSKFYLEDKFLYNLIFNSKKEYYSLQEQDEYFEKIEHRND